MIELLLGIAILLFIRNRMRASFIQSQKEELMREVVRQVNQKRKLDELYGRNQDRRLCAVSHSQRRRRRLRYHR